MAEIIPYSDEYAGDFLKINLEWLDAYHFTEPHDLLQLQNPRTEILNNADAVDTFLTTTLKLFKDWRTQWYNI